MSNNTQTQKLLLDIYHHEVAACDIYKEVLSHIKNNKIYDQIRAYLGDHENHVRRLTEILNKISTQKIEKSKDIKGFFMSAYAILRSMTGQNGAIKALHTAEGVILRLYQGTSREDLAEEYKQLIQSHLKDEEKHNAYVSQLIEAM